MPTRLFLAVLVSATLTAGSARADDMITLGGAMQLGYGPGELSTYGFGGMVEGKYHAIGDLLMVGARVEWVALFGAKVDGATDIDIGIRAQKAYFLKLETSPIPVLFGALNIGYYDVASVSQGTSGVGIQAGDGFGVAPQLGVDLGPFRMALLYHYMFSKADVTVDIQNPKKVSQNVIALELGGQFSIL